MAVSVTQEAGWLRQQAMLDAEEEIRRRAQVGYPAEESDLGRTICLAHGRPRYPRCAQDMLKRADTTAKVLELAGETRATSAAPGGCRPREARSTRRLPRRPGAARTQTAQGGVAKRKARRGSPGSSPQKTSSGCSFSAASAPHSKIIIGSFPSIQVSDARVQDVLRCSRSECISS